MLSVLHVLQKFVIRMFITTILLHQSKSLVISKLQLRDTAAQTIAGFMLMNANCETDIDLLKESIDEPQKINAYDRT